MTTSDRMKIEKALKILELSNKEELSKDIIKKNYYRMSKRYHPDLTEEKYKDGKMFIRVKVANEFLNKNLKLVNQYIIEIKNLNSQEIDSELLKRAKVENEYKIKRDNERKEMIRKAQEEEKNNNLIIISKLSKNYTRIKSSPKLNYCLNEIKRHYYEDYEISRNKLANVYDNYNPVIRVYNLTIIIETMILLIYTLLILLNNTVLYFIIILIISTLSLILLLSFAYVNKNNLIFYTNLTDKEYFGDGYKLFIVKTIIKIFGLSIFITGIISIIFGGITLYRYSETIQLISGILFIVYGAFVYFSSYMKIKAI